MNTDDHLIFEAYRGTKFTLDDYVIVVRDSWPENKNIFLHKIGKIIRIWPDQTFQNRYTVSFNMVEERMRDPGGNPYYNKSFKEDDLELVNKEAKELTDI